MKKGERESIIIRRNISIRTLEREKNKYKIWERNIKFFNKKEGELPGYYYNFSIAYIITEYLNFDCQNHYTIEEKFELKKLAIDMYKYFND